MLRGLTRGLLGMGSVPLFKVFMSPDVVRSLGDVLYSGYIGQGRLVERFEDELERWIGSGHVVTVNSGTSSILLALVLSGVGPGTEVISTPMTCLATNVSIYHLGAETIWADVCPRSGEIDASDVERKMSSRVKAIVAVDWGGYPCNLDSLMDVAARYGARVIEDAAHSLGALYRGRPIGAIVDFTCLSFQAIKHLTTVDGGALVCRLESDSDRARLLRWYGMSRLDSDDDMRLRQDVREIGYKIHMNDVAACIGMSNMDGLSERIAAARRNAGIYDEACRELVHVRPLFYELDRRSSYWLYTVLVDSPKEFASFAAECGVQASQVHRRNDTYSAWHASATSLPGVDEFSSRQISVPVGWWVDPLDIVDLLERYDRRCEEAG